jgi:glutamate-1-semialdehyde 2,1-aminomutase
MPIHGQKTHELYERAAKVMPLGVNSNFRYWGADETPVIAYGKDGYVYDYDDNRYIDYRLGFGPIILGHADPFVNGRVATAVQRGLSFAATHELEVKVAERLVEMCPSVEMVRLSSTGSEVTMHAIRLARGYTGRDLILKFEGSYHGAHDHVLWSTAGGDITQVGDRRRPRGYKQSWGIPELMRELLVLCPWNDKEVLAEILQEKGEQIAAIIIEPALGNGAGLLPDADYMPFLRQQCDQYGIVLIFDEVKTGFRMGPGGASEYFGVLSDLATFAKAMGNGYPIAAFGGKKEIMMTIGPGKVFHGGTYNGNVVSTAAADATLEFIQTQPVFENINKVGNMLMSGIGEILNHHGVPHHVTGVPGMFGICFREEKPRNWRELRECNWDLYESITQHLIARGVFPESDGMEPYFLCSDHTEADAALTLEAFEEGVKLALAA